MSEIHQDKEYLDALAFISELVKGGKLVIRVYGKSGAPWVVSGQGVYCRNPRYALGALTVGPVLKVCPRWFCNEFMRN